jgi:alpha-mannosidase
LEKWAEPFSAFASRAAAGHGPQAAVKDPLSMIRLAWQLLMECHPHDSICGCSVDQVHEEMKPRFAQVEQISEEITRQSLEALAGVIKTTNDRLLAAGDPSAVVVFNPSPTARTDAVTLQISSPSGMASFEIIDEAGDVVPHQSASGRTTDFIDIRVRREELGGLLRMVHEGRVGNLAVQNINFERQGETLSVEAVLMEDANPRSNVWNSGLKVFQEYINDGSIKAFHIHAHSPDAAAITFVAGDIPPQGWKTYFVREKRKIPAEIKVTPWMRLIAPLASLPFARKLLTQFSQPKNRPPYVIENDIYSVELDPGDRTLKVTDKGTGEVYRGLNRFSDSGDRGDEYNYSPLPEDSRQAAPDLRGVTIHQGPVRQTMTVSLTLRVPLSLSPGRKSRFKELVDLPITSTITLTQGVPRVDVHTQVVNRARDHRLRVHFPTALPRVGSAFYDGHFEIVERPIGIPAHDTGWVEEPRPEMHQRAFTSVTDGTRTMTIANQGLPESEVLNSTSQGVSGPEIALTLLRCVGWLSRDDLSTRKDHAGPFLETPAAQMPGEWEFDYSIIPGNDPLLTYQEAWNFDSPLRAVVTEIHPGKLPSSGSFVRVSDPSFVISAVKEAEDGSGLLVRGYHIGAEIIPVVFRPWQVFKNAEQVNMAEEQINKKIKVGRQGEVAVDVRGHEVLTIRLR